MVENIFDYKSYSIDDDLKTVRFFFETKKNNEVFYFEETVKFPALLKNSPAIDSALKSLHLALGISYYKIFVNNAINHPYHMDRAESDFWNSVFENGLGEFLYVNKLSKDKLAKFQPQDGEIRSVDNLWKPEDKAILGIGGGKDSIVAGELLKKINLPLDGFVLATGEQLGQTKQVANAMEIDLLATERSLDRQLLELQEREDAYKGHIPISLIFGLIGSVIAIANNSKYVVVANESSASIPRAEWQGKQVNHQWSKSFDFEIMLQKYIHSNISPELTYFSAIRTLSSVAIAKLFANMSQYLEIFTSDNSVFRIDKNKRPNNRWSLDSPKSLSSFILLAPWLTEEDLIKAFGRNFLDEQSLEDLLYRLLEIEGEQPLDCVGTTEELILSLNLATEQGKFRNSHLYNMAYKRGAITRKDWRSELNKQLTPSHEHAIPNPIYTKLQPLLENKPSLMDTIEGKDIVFVGTGRGRALAGIEEYLRKNANLNSFKAVDKEDTERPLDFLRSYDLSKTIFIKNEAIPGSEMPVPYITPMQLFFLDIEKRNAKLIGITGTKGKSTTAALTAHILKQAGKDVVLTGNIGNSVVSTLLNSKVGSNTFFVIELSSYQLSDIKPKLSIAVCVNLYNDHANWHGSVDKYWSDKQNIVRGMTNKSHFVYNPEFDQLSSWLSSTEAIPAPINTSEDFDMSNSALFGDHNRLNILIAKKIANLLGIDDDTVKSAVNSFEPLKHRMQLVTTKDSITYIDDAIGMTPESTIASIKAVVEKYGSIGCIMLGGQDRNYDFKELLNLLHELNVPNLVLFPNTIQKIKDSLPGNYSPKIIESSDMEEAVNLAAKYSPNDSVVLLSTAAPSYSIWEDFEDKGNQFQLAVQKLSS